MREALFAIVLAVAGACSFAPSAGAVVPTCDAIATISTAPAQDDGYSGLDAGGTPATSVELPGHGSYWGLLDTVQRDGADLADWFALEVPYTRDEANFSVGSNMTGAQFLLEVFLPGQGAPALTIRQEDGEVPIALTPPGLWLMRVTPIDAPAAPGVCAGAGTSLVGPSGVSGTNTLVHNYGLYFGCDPLCAWSA